VSAPTLRRRLPARSYRLRLLLIAAGVILLVAGVTWALFFSSWFTVEKVEVTGVSVLSSDDVLGAAAIRSGAPLVRLDGVTERVAALLPVDDVTVARHWPHTVVITVVERKPVLAVPSDQGFAVYDHEGVKYLDAVAAPDGVPKLTTEDPDDLVVQGVIEMLGALPDAVRARLVSVRAETLDSIELDLTGDVVVVWGSADQSARKAQVLVALMKQPGRVYIVSAPDAPAIRQ
jgi:cell division protein FtsQ